jgi:hypothetical protein
MRETQREAGIKEWGELVLSVVVGVAGTPRSENFIMLGVFRGTCTSAVG